MQASIETYAPAHAIQEEQYKRRAWLTKCPQRSLTFLPAMPCITESKPSTTAWPWMACKNMQWPSEPCPAQHHAPTPPRTAPVLLEDCAVEVGNYQASVRFATHSRQQSNALTATNLTVISHRYLTPLRTTNLIFVGHDSPEPSNKRAKRTATVTRKPRFNIARPVKNAGLIHLDAWRIIFSYSSLGFLLEARTVCKAFNELLSDSSIWKTAREHQFSANMPSPPGGISEQLYADLLVGKGCQHRSCARANSSKVYWAFRLRLCQECLRRVTITSNSLRDDPSLKDNRLMLLHLLPAATYERGKYGHCRRFSSEWGQWAASYSQLLFLKRDLLEIQLAFSRHTGDTSDLTEIQLWTSQRLREVGQFALDIESIEKWDQAGNGTSGTLCLQRYTFFAQKVAELTPPMSPLVLHKFLAYQKALSTDQASDGKAWASLLPEILAHREKAEALLWGDPSLPSSETFSRLWRHRNSRTRFPPTFQPEQEFVLRLATQAVTLCKNTNIPDSNLVLSLLQMVREMFYSLPDQERPRGLNANGSIGPYRLSMDDARMIIEEIIEPHFHPNSPRTVKILKSFKCMGCHRKDWSKHYSFVSGFDHIHQQHAQVVGAGSRYNELFRDYPQTISDEYFGFPWYTVEWPLLLPLIPHQFVMEKGTFWDPETSIDFCSAAEPRIAIFDGRSACKHTERDNDDFIANAKYSANLLHATGLSSLCQTKIALAYALHLHKAASEASVSLDTLMRALHSIHDANSKIELRFRCGICIQDKSVHRGSSFVRYPVELHSLVQHWRGRHANGDHDAIDLIDLRDDFDAMDEVLRTDANLRQSQEKVRRRETKRLASPRMRATPKAAVVLQTRFAIDILDTLFPKDCIQHGKSAI